MPGHSQRTRTWRHGTLASWFRLDGSYPIMWSLDSKRLESTSTRHCCQGSYSMQNVDDLLEKRKHRVLIPTLFLTRLMYKIPWIGPSSARSHEPRQSHWSNGSTAWSKRVWCRKDSGTGRSRKLIRLEGAHWTLGHCNWSVAGTCNYTIEHARESNIPVARVIARKKRRRTGCRCCE